MKSLQNKRIIPSLSAGLIVIALIIGLRYDYTYAKESNDSYYTWADIFGQVMMRAHRDYVLPLDDSAFVTAAINGALETLDPHTVFFQPEEYDNLITATEGEFGGLGIQISMRDKILTVMTPISGTPASRAGIRSGDKILKIEGKSTKGITTDIAVKQLRGKVGTKVTITIGREGVTEPFDVEITRGLIDMNTVPYAGLVNDSIGYVKLTSFSQKAGQEVARYTDSLLGEGMKGMILDLRFNPGGLLTQAKTVSQIFLPKKSLVVYTEARGGTDRYDLVSRTSPILPKDMPLVVLVNGASASAAEIVAGAIQDHDRGVVLGDTTYGKGSVQTILLVDAKTNSHMKMTQAYYYTPSGRCINRPDKRKAELEASKKEWTLDGADEESDSTSDTTLASDTAEVLGDTTTYFTTGGRKVYGGGGIIPDTIVDQDLPVFVVQQIVNKDMFFSFTTSYYPTIEKAGTLVDENFKVSEKIMGAFYDYLDTSDLEIVTAAEKRFHDFKVYAGFEVDTAMDSSTVEYLKLDWSESDTSVVLKMISSLEDELSKNRQNMIQAHEVEIKRYLRESFIAHALGEDNPYLYAKRLERDEQVNAAIELLASPKEYQRIFKK